MNVQTVGNENLPNVFIEEIFVYSSGDPLLNYRNQRIVVRLSMYDHVDAPAWRRDEMSAMKIKIAFVTDNTRQALNEGTASLYDYESSAAQRERGNAVFVVGSQEFVRGGGVEGFHRYTKTIETIMDEPEDLSVYAACFVDDLELGSDLLNKFYGPMSAERVYVGGEINSESGYFYYPNTNEEYGGPVHGQNNTWMEGSEHVSRQHERLRYVEEENYKIKVITGITDPNEFLPEEPGPQSGVGNDQMDEALAGIEYEIVSNLPLDQMQELPENNAGSNFDPDEAGGY